MNCKPNDLAMVVRNVLNDPCFGKNIGLTVEVVDAYPTRLGLTAWGIKRPVRCAGCGVTFVGILDADLRPIRPAAPAATTSVSEGLREVLTEPVA